MPINVLMHLPPRTNVRGRPAAPTGTPGGLPRFLATKRPWDAENEAPRPHAPNPGRPLVHGNGSSFVDLGKPTKSKEKSALEFGWGFFLTDLRLESKAFPRGLNITGYIA